MGLSRIRREEVLRYLGHGGQDLDSALLDRIEQGIQRCERELNPRFVWRAFNLVRRGSEFEVADTTLTLRGASMNSYLDGACGVALLAGTLGVQSEATLRLLGSTDPLGQLIYDAACTDLVEWGADRAQEEIVEYAQARALTHGMRYSPGYGDLSLNIQPVILDILQASKRLGLTVTPQHLLVPTKSITALIGLYPATDTAEKPVPGKALLGCAACALRKTCQIRARGQRCHRIDETIR